MARTTNQWAALGRLLSAVEPRLQHIGASAGPAAALAGQLHAPERQLTSLAQFGSWAVCRAAPTARGGVAAWPSSLQLLRRLSDDAASKEAAIDAAVEDTLRPKVLRLFAFLMICGAGLNVLPAVAAASVGNCLRLLDAQQPFMVKAGCSRLQLLMRMEAGRSKAVEEGAARKLLQVVQQPHADAGVLDYALSTLELLAGCEAGLQSLADEGGTAALQSYLAGVERSPTTEDAVGRAEKLVAALAAL